MCFATHAQQVIGNTASDWPSASVERIKRFVLTLLLHTHTQPPLSSGVLPEAQSILITQPWACVCTLSLPLIPCVLPSVCSCPVLSLEWRIQGPQPNDSIQPCRLNSVLSTQTKYGFKKKLKKFFLMLDDIPTQKRVELKDLLFPHHCAGRVKQEV